MILDGLLLFTGTAKGGSGGIASGSYTDAPTTGTQDCTNIIDLGLSGIPTSANGGGARDIGNANDPRLTLMCRVTVAFTGGTNLYIELQGAPDGGSGSPGSYTTMFQSQIFTEAEMIAGADIANVDIPKAIWEQVLPRFLQLVCVSTGTHSAGQIEAGIVLNFDEQIIGTTGQLSGYPAGVVVAN